MRQKAQRGVALSADDTLHLLKIRLLHRYFFPRSLPFFSHPEYFHPLFLLFIHSFLSLLSFLFFLPLPLPQPESYSRAESDLEHHEQPKAGEKGVVGRRVGLPTKTSPKFLFPDSIPFHLTSRKLLFDSSLCRRLAPLFPMHMTVSKKTHCERPGYNLLRA